MEKDKGGRPTKLTEELIEKASTYLDTCRDSIVENKSGGIAYVWVNLPKVVSFAIYLGIHKSTVYDFCITKEGDSEETCDLRQRFSDIVKSIEDKQEELLVNNTLGGLYQPKTANMILARHGYVEKTEQKLTGSINITERDEIEDKLDAIL